MFEWICEPQAWVAKRLRARSKPVQLHKRIDGGTAVGSWESMPSPLFQACNHTAQSGAIVEQ